MKSTRPSKDQYYLNIAKEVSERSTCLKAKLGAVVIRDDQIISTGYNGSPRGTKSSLERGFCLRQQLNIPSGQRYEICRSVHAEQNAIINAARAGVSLLGGDIYIYGFYQETQSPIDALPCFICKKMIINCGLKRCVCSTKDGGLMIFNIEDWIQDWVERDILDDQNQYGGGISVDEIKEEDTNVKTTDALK